MDFKKISDLFTLAVPVLIVCSCIRLITYYQHWNIPILEYLSASEILLLFIQPIFIIAGLGAIYFASMVLMAAALLLVFKKLPVSKSKETSQQHTASGESAGEKKDSLASILFGVLSFGGMGGVLFLSMWSEFKVVPAVLFHMMLLLGVAGVVRSALPASEQNDRTKPVVAATLVVLLSASFFSGRYQARSTETNPTRLELVLRDETLLKADPDRVYVGKTSNYYFFHSKNETSIIPVGEVRATYIK
jgi:Ca2+/Na+ antiporter